MVKVKHLLALAAAVILTLGLAGMAHAAAITCGGCHSATPVDADNCNNNARALHGTHVNYSSATYKETVANNGKCTYCHSAVADAKGIASATHNNNYINVTGNVVGSIATTGLDYNTTNKTCANACHKNRSDSTAKWGNYTATTVGGIKLNCFSCHDDSSNNATSTLSGQHKNHVLSNVTTPSGTKMNAANNAGCNNCHPDNSADLWSAGKADNGTKKAYPHATDGTNVVADNASLSGQVTGATKNGTSTTCTNACHGRVAVTWGQALDCNMCHYYVSGATSDAANTGTGALSSGHNAHFKTIAGGGGNLGCNNCHPDRSGETAGNLTHVSKVPAASINATVLATLGWSYATQTCSNTPGTCHNGSTPTWSSSGGGCAICHFYPGAAAGKGSTWAAGNGHNVRYDAPVVNTHMKSSGFNYLTDTFTAVVADTTKCGLCHRNVKAHKNGTGFAHLSSSGNGQCGGTFTFSSGGVGNNATTCGSVKCHSGKQTPTMN